MVSIIVYSFDGDERLSLCTQALQDAYGGDHEVIQAPSRGPRGRELTMPEAFNRGASSASGEYLAFVTADTVAAPGWLERLLACAEATGAGAVGPMCNMAAGLQNAPAPMASDEATPAPDPSKWRATVRIAIAPMLVRKDTFLDLGGFDERFGQGGFADDDFCLRLARAGLKATSPKTRTCTEPGRDTPSTENLSASRFWTRKPGACAPSGAWTILWPPIPGETS